MNILETQNLSHDFRGLKVLFDVNLKVKQGEHHAIIGPNGAGKTTLFNVITGTYQPSPGARWPSRAGTSPAWPPSACPGGASASTPCAGWTR